MKMDNKANSADTKKYAAYYRRQATALGFTAAIN